jgi:hypothetical protein
MTTREMPVLRAYAVFKWAPESVEPASPIEFAVGLYSNREISLATARFPGLVSGLKWTDANDAIDDAASSWTAGDDWDGQSRAQLLETATLALRRQMQLPATSGSEQPQDAH